MGDTTGGWAVDDSRQTEVFNQTYLFFHSQRTCALVSGSRIAELEIHLLLAKVNNIESQLTLTTDFRPAEI